MSRIFVNLAGRTGTEERFLQIARNANKVQKLMPDYIPFPCNVTGRTLKIYYYFFICLSTIIYLLVIIVLFLHIYYKYIFASKYNQIL